MPRRGRQKSSTGIYHIMLRGINYQVIFEDDEDYRKMLNTFYYVKEISKCKIFAYCLMPNHCHFLLKVEEEGLDQIFKRLGARYVYWYNLKYKRIGHLFQDRFKSEAVEDDKHLLTVLRYIHQNPIKAGLSKNPSDYLWSSYVEYINKPRLVDIDYIHSIIGKEDFEQFNNIDTTDKVIDYVERRFLLTDIEAKDRIMQICGCSNMSAFQRLDVNNKRRFIQLFKEEGMSIRQINRLTGVSKGIIERAG